MEVFVVSRHPHRDLDRPAADYWDKYFALCCAFKGAADIRVSNVDLFCAAQVNTTCSQFHSFFLGFAFAFAVLR